jgi:glycosyltransferase involved in cell wall biosynthesis
MIRLTVIVTTRNRRVLLKRAVESVINTGEDVEVIIVDDASGDGTKDDWENANDLRYIRLEENKGTAAARNAGIAASTAPIIAFLDDDDYRLPGSLYSQLEFLEKDNDCGVAFAKVYYSNQQNELSGESNLDRSVPEGDVMIDLLQRNFITLSAVMIRKECFEKVGCFDEAPGMLGIEDWDMWLRISEHYKFRLLNEAVAVYRKPEWNSGQWYSDIGRQFTRASKAYHSKWLKLPGLKSRLGKNFRKKKNSILMEISDIIIYGALHNASNRTERRIGMMNALKCQPKNLLRPGFYKALGKSLFGLRKKV